MLKTIISAAALTLFVLFFVILHRLLSAWNERGERYLRLNDRRRSGWSSGLERYLSGFEKPYRYLSDTLEALRWQLKPSGFVLLTLLLLLSGITGGAIVFLGIRGALLLGCVAAGIPLLTLRMVSVHRQLQSRLDFLPAVELFYQCYVAAGARQIRTALQRTVEERRLLGPMQSAFDQLYRNLSVRGDDETSLRIFSASLGHIWGEYFVQILRVGLGEGHPVADNLKMLVTDMRKAQRANQQERNRLLEIRIANFTPLLFLGLFIGINVHYNPDNAYYYYVADPKGRDMMLNAVVLIFLSFVMGVYLSRKKM
jgi:Flp pilus assembly protein TadB